MALTVESLLATASFDPSGLTRGLDTVTRALEQYDRQAAALTARPTTLSVETEPIERSLERLGGALPQIQRQLEALSGTQLELQGAEQLTQTTDRVAAGLRDLAAAVPTLTLPGVDPAPLLEAIDVGLGALAALDRRVRAIQGTPLSLETDELREQVAGVEAVVGTLLTRLRSLTADPPAIRLDVSDLATQLATVRSELAALPSVSVPVGLSTSQLDTALAALDQEIRRLPDGVTVPVTLATQDLPSAIDRVQAALAALGGADLPVSLDTSQLQTMLADVAERITALRDVELPVGLDVEPLEAAVRAVQTRLREIPPTITATADLEADGFIRGIDQLTRGIAQVSQQVDALTARPITLRVDAGDSEAVLARPLALLDRFADTVREVREALPGLRLDPAALTPGLTALDAFLAAADRLASVEFPRLSTREQVAEITTLEQALGRIGPTIAGLDASGVLRNVAAQVRQALGTLRTDLSQQIILDVDTTPFEAGLAAGEAALNGFRARVAVPLPVALEQTGDLTRQLVALEQGVTQAVTEAVRLMTLPVDQLEARLRGLSSLPLGLDIRSFLSQVAQGEAGVAQFIAAIREGAVEELTRLGASAAQVAAVLRGFEALPSVTVDTTSAVASLRVAEDAADSLIAKLGLMRREAASPVALVTAPAPAPPPDPTGILSAQLQQSEQEAARLIGTLDEVAAGMSRAADGTQVWEESLRRLQTQQDEAAATAEHLASANDRLIDGLSQSGQIAAEASAGSRTWERGMAALRAQNEAAGRGFETTSRSTRDLTRSLGSLAVASIGAQGPLSRAALSFLPFLGVSVGVVAAGAAVALAYDRMTASARKMREEQDRLVASLRQRLQQPVPQGPGGTLTPGQEDPDLQRQIAAAESQRAQAAERLRRAEAALTGDLEAQRQLIGSYAAAQGIVAANAQTLLGLERQRSEVARQQRDVQDAEVLLFQLRVQAADQLANSLARSAAQGQALFDAFAGNVATAVAGNLQIVGGQRLLASLIERERAIANDVTADLGTRVRAQQALNALQVAGLAPLQRQLELIQQAAAADLERFQRRAQAPVDVTAPIPLRIDVGTADLRALGRDLDAQIAQVEALRTRYVATSAAAQALADKADAFRALRAQVSGALQALEGAPVELLARATDDLIQRLEILQGQALPGVRGATTAVTATAGRLVAVYAALTAEVERQGGSALATTAALRAQADALAALGDGAAPLLRGVGAIEIQLQQARAALAQFQAQFTDGFPEVRVGLELDVANAERVRDQFFADLERRQRQAGLQAITLRVTAGFDQAQVEADDLSESLAAGAAQADQFFRQAEARAIQFQRALRDTRTAEERLNDAIHETSQGLDRVVGAARNVGLIGEEADRAIASVLDLADAIGSVVESASTGNILGLVGAGVNLLGGLLGGSSENARLAQENSQAVRELTAQLRQSARGLGGQQNIADALQQILATQPGTVALSVGGPFASQALRELEVQLARFGLNLDDVDLFAASQGIDLLTDKGRLVAGAFEDLIEATKKTIEAQLKFNDIFDEQQQRLDFRAAFTGADQGLDPLQRQQAAFQRELDAFIATIGTGDERLNSFLAQQLTGLDITDADAIRAAFLRIFEQFDTQQLTAEDLGDLTREDLFRLFGDAAGFLDELGRSAGDAAERLGALNVPTVLRLDALRAQASLPEPTLRAFDQPLVNLQTLNQRAAETFGIREESQSFDALADRLGDIAPLERFLQQIATETPDDLLDALRDLSATIGDRGPSAGAAQLIRETVDRRTEVGAQAGVHIEYHGPITIQIHAQPGQSPQEIADAVARRLQDHAMADFGDLTRAGDALGGI